MKNLYFLIFIICSCSLEPSEVKQQIEIKDAEFEMVEFPVEPPFMNNYFEGLKSAKLDGEDYLVGLNFMRNKIDFINLVDSSKNFSMQVRREGPNAVKSYLLSVNFFENSFLLITHTNAYLCEMDMANQAYDLIKSYDFLPEYQLSPVSSNIGNYEARTWAFDNTEVFFPIFLSISVADHEFLESKSMARIDLKTNEISRLDLKWPKILEGQEGITFPFQLDAYSVKRDNELYVSYPFTDSVFIYSIGQYEKPINVWNTPVVEFKDLVHLEDVSTESLITDSKRDYPFTRSGLFFPLCFNDDKQVFYRLVKDGYPLDGQEKNLYQISRYNLKWLVEYDLNGEVLTVRKLPKSFDVTPVVINGDYLFPFLDSFNNKEDVMQLAKVKGYSK